MRMMFPQASAETLKILKTTTKVMQKDNVCCGMPHLAHGLRDEFLALAKKNIRLTRTPRLSCATARVVVAR